MSRNGNNGPSMDLNELLRKHDEYRQRQGRSASPAPQLVVQRTEIKPQQVQPQPVAAPVPTPPAEEKPFVPQAPVEPQISVEPAAPRMPEDIQPEEPAENIVVEDANDEAAADSDFLSESELTEPEFDDAEDADDDTDPNPFSSMATIFRGAWKKIRRKPDEDEGDLNEEDADFGNEMIPEEESIFDDADELPVDEEVPAKRKKLFGWIKKKEAASDFVYDDSDFADEDYVAEEFPEIDPAEASDIDSSIPEEIPEDTEIAAEEIPETVSAPAEDVFNIDDIEPAVNAVDVQDIADTEPLPSFEGFSNVMNDVDEGDDNFIDEDNEDEDEEEEAPRKFFGLFSRKSRPVKEDEDEEEEDNDEEAEDVEADEDIEDEDVEDEDEDDDGENDAPKKPLLKRFVNLFVVFDDDEDESSEDKDDEEAHPAVNSWLKRPADESTLDFTPELNPTATAARWPAFRAEHKGGTNMDEKNRVNTDMTELLAASLENQGMSRRQRRELAEKQAAEAAAKLAAEEAAKAAAQPAAPLFVEKPVEEEPVVVEEPAASELITPDEPTRIFKPLTSIPAASTETESADSIPGFDDDEEDEEEPAQKRRGFGLFRKKREEEVEDEDDEEEDEEEDDEEEEEEEAPRKSRGLFGKKSRPVKYDEDEDEDEEDDYDDEDEEDYDDDEEDDDYDEYDDFDDDDDDDYDDDDDDDRRPLGLRIIGFFKGLFAFVLCVLIAICALNVLDYFNVVPLDSVFEHHYNKAPEAFDVLFPSHNLKHMAEPEEGITSIDPIDAAATQVPEVTMAPAATEIPEATTAPVAG